MYCLCYTKLISYGIDCTESLMTTVSLDFLYSTYRLP